MTGAGVLHRLDNGKYDVGNWKTNCTCADITTVYQVFRYFQIEYRYKNLPENKTAIPALQLKKY